MSGEPALAAAPTATAWPVLSSHERRVLGVLVEKAKTTPDVYPLSLNSLVTGCNQKSNRDPVMNLSDDQVEEALTHAQQKGLAVKVTGGRVERWRHTLYESWQADKVELAILAELLLRGPQTEGEMRGRASRMEPIADLDALRAVLRQLAQRGLVVYLTPEGRRGTTLTHGFQAPDELEHLRARHGGKTDDMAEATHERSAAPAVTPRPADDPHAEIASLRANVTELHAKIADLAEQIRAIKDGLGM